VNVGRIGCRAGGLTAGYWGRIGHKVEVKEESSFCEQKEAKKLCQLERPGRSRCAPGEKSFLLLFFKKDASFFTSTY